MNTNTKILMFGWEFPPYNSGGLGIACLGLTKSLVKSGVSVSFVLPKKFDLQHPDINFVFADTQTVITRENFEFWKQILNPYTILNKQWKEEGFEEKIRQIIANSEVNSLGQDIYSEVAKYTVLSKTIIQNQEFDCIHCHDWLTIKAGILAKQMTGKPLVFHIHATEFDRTGGNVNQLIYDIEREGFEYADKIIAVSNFTKKIICKHYGVDANKVEVVHNGIDYHLESTASKDEEILQNLLDIKSLGYKLVTFIGRFTYQKGIEYFLEAAKTVLEKDKNLKFVVVGGGDMEENIIEKVASLGLSTSVIFTGFLREEKLRSIYSVSDIFVMPSVSEPFGLVALEAIVHHTPTILSKNSGVSEVISHSLKVDFWDSYKIAHFILAILEYEVLHKFLSTEAKNEVQKISWDKASQKIKNLYQEVS